MKHTFIFSLLLMITGALFAQPDRALIPVHAWPDYQRAVQKVDKAIQDGHDVYIDPIEVPVEPTAAIMEAGNWAYDFFGISQLEPQISSRLSGTTTGSKGRWGIKPNNDTYNTVLTGTTVTASVNYSHYYTNGTIDNIALGSAALCGPFYFTSKGGSTTFTAYNNPAKTTSNVSFSATIADGETITMQWNPLNKKYTSSTTVTSLDVGNTSIGTLAYGNYGNLTGGTLVVPGTVSIVAGGVTFVDDGFGNLTGTGGSGWISYDTNYFTIYFDSAPTAGDILASYQYYSGTAHQAGMWEKVD